MKVIYGISRLKKYKKPVAALGVFDGVHRGHINILKDTVRKARGIKGTSIVLTFWPHPQREESLYSLEHRLRLIAGLGIDVSIVINFNRKFANLSAEDFIKDILAKKIGAQYIYVGRNFRFGKDAGGDYKKLVSLSRIYNFKVKAFKVIKINNRAVSSTYIRALIKKGALDKAKRLLTRPVTVLGSVVRGISQGKKLGFPTANIDPHHEVIPPSGIYAVRVILKAKKFYGLCYIGLKPTFFKVYSIAQPQIRQKNIFSYALKYGIDGRASQNYSAKQHRIIPLDLRSRIEVYIFDFKKNIYANFLEVQFIKKLREEKKFTSVSTLVSQIKKDILTARRLFSLH